MTKKVAIMQPYFFPYIGYWQLMNAVDMFVILDDVNFIKRGFINRNNILLNNQPYMFSIPLERPSQNKLIMDTKLNFSDKEKDSFLKTINLAYKKAPYFETVFSLIQNIVKLQELDLTKYIHNSFNEVNKYLGIDTRILVSSNIKKDESLKSQSKILEIAKKLNAGTYINAIGGQELYDKDEFNKNDINLFFIKTGIIKYKQFNAEFVSNLSIIDVMMFNSKEQINEMLNNYELI